MPITARSKVVLSTGNIFKYNGNVLKKNRETLIRKSARYCKAISYTVGFVSRKRPFSTEAQIELSYTVEKGLFRLNFFD